MDDLHEPSLKTLKLNSGITLPSNPPNVSEVSGCPDNQYEEGELCDEEVAPSKRNKHSRRKNRRNKHKQLLSLSLSVSSSSLTSSSSSLSHTHAPTPIPSLLAPSSSSSCPYIPPSFPSSSSSSLPPLAKSFGKKKQSKYSHLSDNIIDDVLGGANDGKNIIPDINDNDDDVDIYSDLLPYYDYDANKNNNSDNNGTNNDDNNGGLASDFSFSSFKSNELTGPSIDDSNDNNVTNITNDNNNDNDSSNVMNFHILDELNDDDGNDNDSYNLAPNNHRTTNNNNNNRKPKNPQNATGCIDNNNEEDYDDDDDDDDEEEEEEIVQEEEEIINEDEIDAMLDVGMPSMPKAKRKIGKETLNAKLLLPFDDKDFMLPRVCEKVLLIDRGRNPFDILPEGWIIITHMSGMPLYLHKKSRVCTLSRPYFIGPGSVRRHDIPVSSIPCLQYKKALEEAGANQTKDINNAPGNPKVAQNNPVNDSNVGDVSTTTTEEATATNADNEATMATTTVDNHNPTTVTINNATTSTSTNNNAGYKDINNHPGNPSNNNSNRDINNPPGNSCPKDLPAPPGLPNISRKLKVQTFEEHKKINSLDPLAFREYCQKLFEFRTITIRRFKRWKDRRKHNQILKNAGRPTLAPTTKLITCQLQNDKGAPHHNKKKEFVLNPAGKSAVCILHEYAQHAIKVQPKYKFTELENSQTPYSATVIINEIQYGTGYASSKKLAKLEAARVTLDILIPEINKDDTAPATPATSDASAATVATTTAATAATTTNNNNTVDNNASTTTGNTSTTSTNNNNNNNSNSNNNNSSSRGGGGDADEEERMRRKRKMQYSHSQDLEFFDSIDIQDPRLLDLCTTAGHPTPFQILYECLQRNYGMGDTAVKMEMKPLKRQKSEFIMRVGKHEAKVICKNKREGKQQASQAILQLLHPHIKNWGSLLRLYSKANEVQEKRAEEHSVTELQTKAQPNKAILGKLRKEMNKLYTLRREFNTDVTERFHLNGHEIRSAELGGVEL